MPGRATANLLITDKRSDGYPTAHAWGLDWRMADLDHTVPLASPYQNAASSAPEWSLVNLRPIRELNAVILACHAGSEDMNLANWHQAGEGYWKEVQPPGRQKKWLKWYDARPNQTDNLLSLNRLTANPTWRFSFLRAQPPLTQEDPVQIAITLNALGTVRYQIYLPQLWLDAPATQPATLYPSLWKCSDNGATWQCVDKYLRDEAQSWAASAFERFDHVYCRFIPDHLVINLGESAEHWVYYEDGLQIGEGHVQIDVSGGQIAWNLKQALYMPSGSVERLLHIVPPDFINPAADSLDYLGDVSAGPGCGITAAMQSGAGEIWPQATLISTGNHTPVLYELQATRPAIHDPGVAAVLFDNLTVPADQGKLLDVEFWMAQGWRGSHFTARIATTTGADEYAIGGNEKAQLAVMLDTDPSYTTVGTGYLESPTYEIDPTNPNQIILELTAHDRLTRLAQKRARDLPAFDGWSFADAFTWALHECGSVPDTDIALDAGAADFVYPIRMGELLYRFDQTACLTDVLDELARAAGREWGVDVDGKVFTRALGTAAYSGTPDYVLDETDLDEEDHIYHVAVDRDLSAVRNHVMVIGRDPDTGAEVRATWRMTESLSDPTSDPFVGDDWWEVEIAPEGCNPWVRAAFLGEQLSRYRCIIVWQTNGKPWLQPDMYVETHLSYLGIPDATICRVIESHGRLNCESGEFISHITMVPI